MAEVDARISRITVYASGACVRRVTEVASPIPDRIRISGLPVAVIDDTVRVEIDGPAIAVRVRAGMDVPPAPPADEESPELRAAWRRVKLAEAEVTRLRGAIEQLARAPIVAAEPSDALPPAWREVVAARRSVIAVRGARDVALRDQHAAARRELEDAQRAAAALSDRERRAGTARAAKLHELRKYVEIELAPATDAGGAIAVHLEYLVGAARWAPSYVARLDADRTILELRAVVAQETGEDWTAVPLALSTAEPARFAELPELAEKRIGRRQAEPVRAGFRPPPVGAEALFADFDRERGAHALETVTMRAVGVVESPQPEAGEDGILAEVWDEASSHAKDAYDTPAEKGMMPRAPAAPAAFGGAPPQQVMKTVMGSRSASAPMQTLVGAGAPAQPAKPPSPPPPVPRLDYGNLRMAPPSSRMRGRLVPAPQDPQAAAVARDVATTQARIAALALPAGCAADWLHAYDYAFATDGAVDVRADGAWHSIAVTAVATQAKLRHVAVPREQPAVFRVAAIANAFAGPLLPGPIDVYDRGRFLVTSAVEYTPPGGSLDIGLGVDPAVKIARNTEFREEVGGMLRGALKLHHAIAIDVENLSGRAIELEVRERVPVTRDGDDDVEVAIGRADPAWERWTPDPDGPGAPRLRGGFRWRLTLAAAQKRTLRASYEAKIAGKHELVGGNRRER